MRQSFNYLLLIRVGAGLGSRSILGASEAGAAGKHEKWRFKRESEADDFTQRRRL